MNSRQMILAVALCGLSSGALASGFALSGKSASNTGNAFSGTATLAEDASVVYTNPAAMQDIDGTELSVALSTVTPNLRYKDDGAGGNTSVTDPHYIPNLYYVRSLNSDVRFGLGIYAPFGLGLDYKDNWAGRYVTVGSDLKIINVSPAISFKASPQTNLAFGIDMQYLSATLKNAYDFSPLGGGDGSLEITGTNWAMGYTLGLTHDFDEANRFGMTFHSAVRQDVAGKADWTGKPGTLPLPYSGWFNDGDGNVTLILPESLSLGYRRTVSPQLQVMVDATWTRWSRYDELAVEFGDGTPTSRTAQNWEDVWRVSVGANYQMNDTWLLRGGLAYDPSPIPDAAHRSARIPDGNRTWITAGANTSLTSDIELDLALAYAPDNKYRIDNSITGEYTSSVTYFITQINWKF